MEGMLLRVTSQTCLPGARAEVSVDRRAFGVSPGDVLWLSKLVP